jgi:hypothetical protein
VFIALHLGCSGAAVASSLALWRSACLFMSYVEIEYLKQIYKPEAIFIARSSVKEVQNAAL